MTSKDETMTKDVASTLDWVSEHLKMYLSSAGAKGHIIDARPLKGHRFTTTLLLETIGRKSGTRHITPLIYGDTGGEVVIVASKGGADTHPAWYLNLQASKAVSFQIATQAFRANWREPQGNERKQVWAFMEQIYPPYRNYQASTEREIPLVMLSMTAQIDVFREDG